MQEIHIGFLKQSKTYTRDVNKIFFGGKKKKKATFLWPIEVLEKLPSFTKS